MIAKIMPMMIRMKTKLPRSKVGPWLEKKLVEPSLDWLTFSSVADSSSGSNPTAVMIVSLKLISSMNSPRAIFLSSKSKKVMIFGNLIYQIPM